MKGNLLYRELNYILNPKILKTSKEMMEYEEGCLSIPEILVKTKRHKWIEAEFNDLEGNTLRKRFFDDEAICF